MGYSPPRDKRASPATGALASLRQEGAGRVDSEYVQQTMETKVGFGVGQLKRNGREICI